MTEDQNSTQEKPRRRGCLRLFLILACVSVVSALLTAWWIKHNIYASLFRPTRLSQTEQEELDTKLARIQDADSPGQPLEAEAYAENHAQRLIRLTEKELNSLIARDGDAAKRVAIDLSDDLVSLKFVVPFDDEIPIVGGKTLRLHCGMELGYEAGAPVVAIRGVSVGGVPLPDAWWGRIKDTNLVQKFGGQGGFWDLFAEGVEDIEVRDGHLRVKLKE